MIAKGLQADDVKRQAAGKWLEILSSVGGISRSLLDGKNHACPKCGTGDDRFAAFKDVAETGGVNCRICQTKCGDGLATIQWIRGCSFRQSLELVGDYLGIVPTATSSADRDVVAEVAKAKRVPVDALTAFGAHAAMYGGKPVCRVPMYGPDGKQCSHFDMAVGAGEGLAKGLTAEGKKAGLFLPRGVVPPAGETVLLVEGVKDAAALHALGYHAIGVCGANMQAKFARMLQGRRVVIIPDRDTAGLKGSGESAANLAGVAESVRVAALPAPLKETGGADVRDILAKEGGAEMVRQAIEDAVEWKPPVESSAGLPEIELTRDEAGVAMAVITELGKLRGNDAIYVRGGELVGLLPSDEPGQSGKLVIRPLPVAIVRERITVACRLVTYNKTREGEWEKIPACPPKWLVDAISQRGYYGGLVRPLRGVVYSPTLRADGSVLQEPGYDPQSGLFLVLSGQFPTVPENPTSDQVAAAVAKLLDVVCDFPFASEADRSAWLAMLLTMVGRPLVDGCVPMCGVSANTRGTGKGLAVETACEIAYGRSGSAVSLPGSEAEQRKLITSFAVQGQAYVRFDNIAAGLESPVLDGAITARLWEDRLLGFNKTSGEVPLTPVWIATGNNLTFGSDMARRVLPIRVVSPVENPESREDFKHPDLLAYVKQHRGELVVAALTILRGFVAAGRPACGIKRWGSFESWASTIATAVRWAGLADPTETRAAAESADESKDQVRAMLAGLLEADPDRQGVTVKEIERLIAHKPDQVPTCPTLAEVVSTICGDKYNSRSVARFLVSASGRVVGGERVASRPAGKGVKKWLAEVVDQPRTTPNQPRTTPNQPSEQPTPTPKNQPNTGFSTPEGWEGGSDSRTSEKIEVITSSGESKSGEGCKTDQPNPPSQPNPFGGSHPADPSPTAYPVQRCNGCPGRPAMTAQPCGPGLLLYECPRCGAVGSGPDCGNEAPHPDTSRPPAVDPLAALIERNPPPPVEQRQFFPLDSDDSEVWPHE